MIYEIADLLYQSCTSVTFYEDLTFTVSGCGNSFWNVLVAVINGLPDSVRFGMEK